MTDTEIDLTPNWRYAMEFLMIALEEGTEESKRQSRRELRKIASYLDEKMVPVEDSKDTIDIKRFHFRRWNDGIVMATNGPVVVLFYEGDEEDPYSLKYQHVGSNVSGQWKHLPTVALAAARWLRANRRMHETLDSIDPVQPGPPAVDPHDG